ncbi:MAG: hypothetical protein HY889_07110 [Deltaproteobacteria bacterium]|nr:hypothetical protein [Deltaproteobacteria bacterium]
MVDVIKPVRFGILIGLLGLILGIGWAVWLVVGHERIHQSLEGIAERAGKSAHISAMHDARESDEMAADVKIHVHSDGASHEHAPAASPQEEKGHEAMGGHVHDDGSIHRHSEDAMTAAQPQETDHLTQGGHEHKSPIMALSHTRLVRGHLHAMGLGLATVLISLLLAFTSAGERVKTIVSVLTGLGGIIYPFAWVVMGYRTPALGPEGAEASVIFIAGPGVGLVLLGVFTAAFFLLRDIFKNKD